MTKKTLAIITARGGSKRLPNKNILDLAGKPLIAWTSDIAKKAKNITKLIISTDNEKIKNVAEKHSIEVPFIRPDFLADDTATSFDVIKHSIDFFKEKKVFFDYVMLLQPTSPLRRLNHINEAFSMLNEETKAIVSVCETEHSPLWSNFLPDNLSMKDFIPKNVKNLRSQDLPKYYRLNGAIYISEIDYFIENKGFIAKDTKAYIMPQLNSIDIDTQLDFDFCEFLIQKRIFVN